jgi:hypothetical protein
VTPRVLSWRAAMTRWKAGILNALSSECMDRSSEYLRGLFELELIATVYTGRRVVSEDAL